MNKEIEELLNELKRRNERYNYCKNNDISFSDEDYKSYLLLSYIEQLEKKVDQYENPDDLTLFYMWLDTKAKDKMKQLEKRNKQLYEGFMATQEELTDYAMKNEQLEKDKKELKDGWQQEIYDKNKVLSDWLEDERKINVLENNRDKAIEYIEEIISSTKGVLNDYNYHKEHNKQLIELLKEDIEMYKHILNILKGDSDESRI